MSITLRTFSSIAEVPTAAWDRLAPRDSVGLESGHLRALETSRINDLHPWYVVGYVDSAPVGIAYCFVIDTDMSGLGGDIPAATVRTLRAWYPDVLRFRVLECGFISALGTAISVVEPHRPVFLAALAAELERIGKIENADFAIVRDIPLAAYDRFAVLETAGDCPAQGFPSARMDLPWASFDQYLAALTSRKRYNIREKLARLDDPRVSIEIVPCYETMAADLAHLVGNVADRATEYRHERLTREYFEAFSRCLPGRSHVLAMRYDGTLAAHAFCTEGDTEYFFAYVGIDYAYRDQVDPYFNLVLRAIRHALEKGKKVIDLGITSYYFKLQVGAELAPYVYLVKHLKQPGLSAALAGMLTTAIVQPENCFQCFTGQDISARKQPSQLFSECFARKGRPDIFTKLRAYSRPDNVRILGLYAQFPPFESAQEPIVRYRGADVVMLGTNSYLGLATHPEVMAAAKDAVDRYGTGCSGSPFMNGTLDLHEDLRHGLAAFMGKDDAMLFSTGYQANVGVLSALLGRDDVVIMDKRNHASLVDGARLSGARLLRFAHADMGSLERQLARADGAPALVVSDTLFSMEGTVIDLPEMVRLARKYGARLMLDESHAIGVMGAGGRGVAEHFGLLHEADVIMGTFSKSFASIGGFVAAEGKIIDTLRHTARSHMFSASMTPASVATVKKALEIMVRQPELRERLLANARFLAGGLADLGFETCSRGGPIVPLYCGDELLTIGLYNKLFDEGVFVNPVVSPAVPRGRELLRLSVMPTHTRETLTRVLGVFASLRTPEFPRPS